MLVTSALSARKSGEIVDLADDAQSEEAPKKKQPLWKSILLAVVGLAGIIGVRAAGCQFCKGNRGFLWNQ